MSILHRGGSSSIVRIHLGTMTGDTGRQNGLGTLAGPKTVVVHHPFATHLTARDAGQLHVSAASDHGDGENVEVSDIQIADGGSDATRVVTLRLARRLRRARPVVGGGMHDPRLLSFIIIALAVVVVVLLIVVTQEPWYCKKWPRLCD